MTPEKHPVISAVITALDWLFWTALILAALKTVEALIELGDL